MKAFIKTLYGAGIGAVIAVGLYVCGFIAEIIYGAYKFLTCNCNDSSALPWMWSWKTFICVLVFCAFGGSIIGLVYGIYLMKMDADEEAERRRAEKTEEARKQRVKWANEINQKAQNTIYRCDKNLETDEQLVMTTYQASSQLDSIIYHLTIAAELQGKVDSIADELLKGEID